MTIYLTHRKFIKQQLHSFKMAKSKTIMEQLTDFNNIFDDLENIEVHLEDEDNVILLLYTLKDNDNYTQVVFEDYEDAGDLVVSC